MAQGHARLGRAVEVAAADDGEVQADRQVQQVAGEEGRVVAVVDLDAVMPAVIRS